MNKKASETLMDNAVYLILLILFFSVMLFFIWDQANGASVWTNYYAKEITKVINAGSPEDEITLDIHKATEVARRNDIISFREIFTFDNIEKEICVKLTPGRNSCYSYFNNVDIVEDKINLAAGSSGNTNTLSFKIIKSQRFENDQ